MRRKWLTSVLRIKYLRCIIFTYITMIYIFSLHVITFTLVTLKIWKIPNIRAKISKSIDFRFRPRLPITAYCKTGATRNIPALRHRVRAKTTNFLRYQLRLELWFLFSMSPFADIIELGLLFAFLSLEGCYWIWNRNACYYVFDILLFRLFLYFSENTRPPSTFVTL